MLEKIYMERLGRKLAEWLSPKVTVTSQIHAYSLRPN